MTSIWQSFIPYHVAQDLSQHPDESPVGREKRFSAIALFADIAGFTAISEALGEIGKVGSEELTVILNRYFEPMIDIIRAYGGIIAKFGGDAMTVLFPYTAETHKTVALQALQGALDLQSHMGDYSTFETQAGVFGLEMKIGLATGIVFTTSVGEPAQRLEYIIAGSLLDYCANAENVAQKGEIVLHPALHQVVKDEVVTKPKAEGFQRLERLEVSASHAPLEPLGDLPDAALQTVSAYIHPSIAKRIQIDQLDFINEHRKVTILFVSFSGFDYDDDPEVGRKLQAYLSKVIRTVNNYGGYLNKVDMGDKGSKYIVLFGAPIAHEDDAVRALHCALDLRDLPDTGIRMGINTGYVYCGQVGSDVRREYTVMGDAVNLAARLMQAAQNGQILVSDSTFAESGPRFRWGDTEKAQVKGKLGLVNRRELIRHRRRAVIQLQEPKYALPMVGRGAELELAARKIDLTLNRQGQILALTAEAGMGKSRLAAEIIKIAAERGLRGYGGECLSHGTKTNYLVWRNILRSFFELDLAWPAEKQIAHLETRLAEIEPAFVQRLPLLGAPLNLPIPENALTQSLDAKLRKESLETLIVACIQQRAKNMPLLFVLEDCHWIDPLSVDLLKEIGRNIASLPVFVLVVYRPLNVADVDLQISRFSHFTEIQLSNFSPQDTEALICLKLAHLYGEDCQPSRDFVSRINQRAQGNPFYIDELLNLIHDQNIDPSDAEILESIELPDSLHSLIISRIDRLTEEAKITLRVASVIGRAFKAGWLWGVYPELGAPERIKTQLEELNYLDITPLDKPEPELEYLFKHIITREVAYASLAVSTQMFLHEQIGIFIERTYPDEIDSNVDLLAYHFGASQNAAKQTVYFRKAGQIAEKAYANQAAIEYYSRLIPLLPEKDQADIIIRIGNIQRTCGAWDTAQENYERASEIAANLGEALLHTRAVLELGAIYRLQGNFKEAASTLERAKEKLESLGDQQGFMEACREIGIVKWSQSNFAEALANFEAGYRFAKKNADPQGEAKFIGSIGTIHEYQGNPEQALDCYFQSYKIANQIGDILTASRASLSIGNIYLSQGDYTKAYNAYADYLHNAYQIGYRQGIGIGAGNLGNLYWHQGEYESALQCQVFHLRNILDLGDLIGICVALTYLAEIHLDQGKTKKTAALLKPAIAIARAIDIPFELADCLYLYADLLTRQESYLDAEDANNEVLKIAEDVEYGDIQNKAELLQIRLSVLLGACGIDQATLKMEDLLQDLDKTGDQADYHYEIWRLDRSREDHKEQAARHYKTSYQDTPNIKYRKRYQELTGETLPKPPNLPALPGFMTQKSSDLDELLTQVDDVIRSL